MNPQDKQVERTQHTTGPWTVNPTGDIGSWIVGTPEKMVADCQGEGMFETGESEANARLIAAAPETAAERDRLREINAELLAMLWALVEVESRYSTKEGTDSARLAAHKEARKLIAKAESK